MSRDEGIFSGRPLRLGVVLTIVVAVVLVVVFGGIAAVHHRNQTMAHMAGEWRQSGGARLSVDVVSLSAGGYGVNVPAALSVKGFVAGRPLRGRLEVPRFPPFGSTAKGTLSGEEWTMRLSDARTLVVTDSSGRTYHLTLAP